MTYLIRFCLFYYLIVVCSTQILAQSTAFTTLVGDAIYVDSVATTCAVDDVCVQFTADSTNQAGAAYYEGLVGLQSGFDFTLCLYFGENDTLGGEGIVIMFHNDPAGLAAIGPSGDQLGFGSISPSLGIVFDTHTNPGACVDDSTDHIIIVRDGNLCNILAGPTTAVNADLIRPANIYADYGNIEDGLHHRVRITWDPINQYLQVFFDDKLRLSLEEDLIGSIFMGDSIYFGASASTGSSVNFQQVCLGSLPQFTFNPVEEGCINTVDFRNWYQAGDPDYGNWTNSFAGQLLTHNINGMGPSFFISPYDLLDVEIKGTIETTNTTIGDDYIGFVFGMKEPIGQELDQYDLKLFSWKRGPQIECNGNHLSQEGMMLIDIDHSIPDNCNPFGLSYYFWGGNSDMNFNVLDSNLGDGLGWELGKTYNFKLIYTRYNATVLLENNQNTFDTLFHVSGCFEPGRFGFYNFSQEEIDYRSFSYKYIADFDLPVNEICLGDTAQFFFLDSCYSEFDFNSIDSLIWDFGDGNILELTALNPDNINPFHLYASPGTYHVNLRVVNALQCGDDISKEITVKPNPIIDLGKDTILCSGSTLLLDASAMGAIYQWNTNDITPTIQVSQANEYQVTVNADGCQSQDSIIVNYYQPAIGITSINNEPSCIDQYSGALAFSVDGGFSPFRYLINGALTNEPKLDSLPGGAYHFQAIDSFNCIADTTIIIEEFPEPTYELFIEPPSCTDQSDALIFVEDVSLDTTNTYSLNGIDFSSSTVFDQLPAGDYSFYIQDSFGCVYQEAIQIENPTLLTLVLPQDTTINLGASLQIYSNTNSLGSIRYQWSPAEWMDCPTCPHPVVRPNETMQYTLQISNEDSCVATADILITVNQSQGVFIPNAFSPNEDGENDLLLIYGGDNVQQIKSLLIFDRWGNLVFGAKFFMPNDPQVGWDGRLKGRLMNPAVFVYLIDIEYIDGSIEQRTGDITLLR